MESIQNENSEGNLFQAMDAIDEQQIIDEMKGHVIDTYVVNVQGKLGLSLAGIKAMAERMKKQGQPLSVEHTHIEESPDGMSFRATAIVKNLFSGEKRSGFAEQKRYFDSSKTKEVPFAYTLAGSKATRNALRAFMPETAMIAAIEEWKAMQNKDAKVSKSFVGGKEVK